MSQFPGEVAIRRAGAVVALAGASALMAMGFPAVEARAHVVLALYAILLLGCAAVLRDLGRRATETARGTAALGASAREPAGFSLRGLGFAGIVLYALYMTGNVAERNKAAAGAKAEAAWPDAVRDFLLFLMFLAGVWAVYLSMIREMGGPPATAAAEASLDGAGVWAVYQPVVVAMDTGKGGPPKAAAEEDPDGVEVNSVEPVVVDSKF